MITQERLKDLFEYDPNTGVFSWKVSPRYGIKVGDKAGTQQNHGYWHIKINQKLYMAHRLAWLYTYGQFPVGDIDHINGIKDDNRLCNLREATRSQNLAYKDSMRDGLKGVWRNGKKWVAAIRYNGKQHRLGSFNTELDGHIAYAAKAIEVHGSFARF